MLHRAKSLQRSPCHTQNRPVAGPWRVIHASALSQRQLRANEQQEEQQQQQQQQQQQWSPHQHPILVGVVSATLALQALCGPVCSAAELSPYAEAKRIVYGPAPDGRIRGCPSNVNPNCVGTGSTNDAYSPAWRAEETSAAAAAAVLEQAISNSIEGAQLLKSMTLQQGENKGAEYRAFGVPSLFGQDVVEFVIRPEGVTDRGWDGDVTPGQQQLVTYRSMAGSVKYIWPIQQPLSDFDTQRKRLAQIRAATGWRVLGCELLECYQ